MTDENQLPPSQWFADPQDPSRWRWWDGAQWTDHYAAREVNDRPSEAARPGTTPVKKRSRFTRELIGNKEERAEAKLERLTAREETTAAFRGRTRRQPTGFLSKSALSQQGSMPTLEQLLTQLDLESPRHPLDEQVEVVGETFHIAGIKKVFRGRGLPISGRGSEIDDGVCVLVPEPWNPHDSNAVAVAIEGHQVGHLPAELACDYARPLAELASRGLLATGQARIWAKEDSGVVRARVTILIAEAPEF